VWHDIDNIGNIACAQLVLCNIASERHPLKL
jgi:hypothetical protein